MIRCNLKKLLQDRDMMQKDLAKKTLARKNTISDLCNNKFDRVSFDLLNRICEELNCELTDIMEYINEKPGR